VLYTEYMERRLSRPAGEAPRAYRMRKRGEAMDRTRQRITDAAVQLHTSVGPSLASMSAVADKAGVTRVTLYRHFRSMDDLFTACMTHWRALHPPPDVERWRAIPGFEPRLRTALEELYRWYARNSDDLYPIYRDAAYTPESNQLARRQTNERQADAILAAFSVAGATGKRLRAAIGHAVRFWTWHSLAIDQGLSTREAAALAAEFVLAARGSAGG
jgi:AcrR family transcriptional regulator